MKFLLSSLTTAALALVASAAPTVVSSEVTRDLPARFAMYLVTGEARANGLRIGYVNAGLHIKLNESKASPVVDGVFRGGRGRIALDRAVHQHPGNPEKPEASGDWNVAFFPGVSQLFVYPEDFQASLVSQGTPATVAKFVQDSQNTLRLVSADGVLQPNGLRVCGQASNDYVFHWDDVPYIDCPVAQFRIVAV